MQAVYTGAMEAKCLEVSRASKQTVYKTEVSKKGDANTGKDTEVSGCELGQKSGSARKRRS